METVPPTAGIEEADVLVAPENEGRVPRLGMRPRALHLSERLHQMPARRRLYLFQTLRALTDLFFLTAAAAISARLAGGPTEPLQLMIFPAACGCGFAGLGLYRLECVRGPAELKHVLVATIFAVAIVVLSTQSQAATSITWILVLFSLTMVGTGLSRTAGKRLQSRLMRSGMLVRRAAVVGTSDDSIRLAGLLSDRDHGYIPVGHVATEPPSIENHVLPTIGAIDRLVDVIMARHIDCLFIGDRLTEKEQKEISRAIRLTGVEARMPNTLELFGSRLTLRPFGGGLSMAVVPVRFSRVKASMKRTMDLVGALMGLVVFLPLLATIAVAVKLSSPGPILFRQERVTKDGRSFGMLKFRTMYQDADEILAGQQIDPTTAFFKLQNDPRVTRLGSFLRRLSLDEIPQLWNVLRGDMSLVGPRPLPSEQVRANADLLMPRLEVRAGLTGWWQINGRSRVSPDHATEMDLYYIENWSLSLDLYILLRTARAVLSGDGAL